MTEKISQSVVEELEVKVAFLEQAMSELSDEYYEQQKELNSLSGLVHSLLEKLTKIESEESGSETIVDERPPHY